MTEIDADDLPTSEIPSLPSEETKPERPDYVGTDDRPGTDEAD
jgi:hypothetical protein